MIIRSIVAPTAERSEVEEALQYEQQRYWRIDYALKADFKIENIRFVHDPNWRESFFSIQGIRDVYEGKYDHITGRVIVWKTVGSLFDVAQLIFTLGGSLALGRMPIIGEAFRSFERRAIGKFFEHSLERAKAERLAREIALSEHVMANVRANMQAKRNRARVTVAGHVYRVRNA